MGAGDDQLDGLWGWSGTERESHRDEPPGAGLWYAPVPPPAAPSPALPVHLLPDDQLSHHPDRVGHGARTGIRPGLLAGGLVVALAVVAAGLVYARMDRDHSTTIAATSTPGPSSSPGDASAVPTQVPSTTDDGTTGWESGTSAKDSASPQDTADTEAIALKRLDDLRRADLASVTLDGQWVAQLASKYVGIEDLLQTTASGGHVFTAADILAEHLVLKERAGSGARVILLLRTDYGSNPSEYGQTMWVTFALGGFRSIAAVNAWCAQQFPELTGAALSNACAPRRLNPPGN